MNPFCSGPGRVYVDGVYVGYATEYSIETETQEILAGWEPIRVDPVSHTLRMAVSMPGVVITRPDWKDYFLGFARAASVRAECSRRKVGAVVVKDKRVIGTGYNGAPEGATKTCLTGDCPRAQSDAAPYSSYDTGKGACIAIHAEANAIIDAGRRNCKGAVIYVTCEPCEGCLRLIKAAGIKRVVWPDGELRKKDLYG